MKNKATPTYLWVGFSFFCRVVETENYKVQKRFLFMKYFLSFTEREKKFFKTYKFCKCNQLVKLWVICCFLGIRFCLKKNYLGRNNYILNQKQLSSRHSLVQSKQCSYQNDVQNLFKVYNKDTRTTSKSFWCLHC